MTDQPDDTTDDALDLGAQLADREGIGDAAIAALLDAGLDSADAIARTDSWQLQQLDGISAEEAIEIMVWAGERADIDRHDSDDLQGQSPDANPRGSGPETGPQTRTGDDLLSEGDESGSAGSPSETSGESEPDGKSGGEDTSSHGEFFGDSEPPDYRDAHAVGESEAAESNARQWGERVGASLLAIPTVLLSLLGGVLWGILGKVPKRTGVYRKMIKMGYTALYKKTDAHVVANTVYGDGEMVPRPAEHDKETGHLETNNGEWWSATSGLQPVRIGDVPVVHGVADHHELVDPVAARIAEAVDMGPSRWATVDRTANGVVPAATTRTGENGHAVADGGGGEQVTIPCEFDDIWVDTSNPIEDNDGMIVSMEKAYELHWDQGSSEEMENQETRGMLAVQETGGERKTAMIYLLIFLGGMAASWGLLGPLAGAVGGSGGGGGGGGGIGIGLWLVPDLLTVLGV